MDKEIVGRTTVRIINKGFLFYKMFIESISYTSPKEIKFISKFRIKYSI